jgi:hypothetical protein
MKIIISILEDLKERFGTFETLAGLTGLGAVAVMFLHPEFIKTVIFLGLAGYFFYLVFVNRTKQTAKEKIKVDRKAHQLKR